MILYRDIPHTYEEVGTGKKFTSATTFLKQFETQIDWADKAEKYSKKYNREQKKLTGENPKTDGAYWQAVWKAKADAACAKGTKYHEAQERKTLESESHLPIVPSLLENDEKFSPETLKLQDGIYPELIVWINSVGIAGQADLVTIEDGMIKILDYKTNAKLTAEPYIRWDGSFDRFSAPINHVPYTTMHKYYLQLNLYAYAIKLHNPNLSVGEMTIRHVSFDENDEPNGHTDHIVPNMQDEIKDILNYVSF